MSSSTLLAVESRSSRVSGSPLVKIWTVVSTSRLRNCEQGDRPHLLAERVDLLLLGGDVVLQHGEPLLALRQRLAGVVVVLAELAGLLLEVLDLRPWRP